MGPLSELNIFIINAKLSLEANESQTLRTLAEELGAEVNAVPIEEADVIVTRVGALGRLERHIALDKAVRGSSLHGLF